MKISVVIPGYNEEQRILGTLIDIYKFFKQKKCSCEVVFVDDGSEDDTLNIVHDFLDVHFLRYQILKNDVNLGKGAAIKKGMLVAKGDFIVFMDADNSTSIKELDNFIGYINKGCEVLIGSRRMKKENCNKVIQPKSRFLVGFTSNIIIQIVLLRGIKDTQCGFKVFSKKAVREIFKLQTLNGWGFDFEILTIAKNLSYNIKEIPVSWEHSIGGKMRFSKVLFTLGELFEVKWNLMRGKYDRAE